MYFRYEDAGQRENHNCVSVLDIWNEEFALWGRVGKTNEMFEVQPRPKVFVGGKEKRKRSGERLMIL
jgi:hypothetical protein